MVNRPFKALGLNGKAVLPMVLGVPCSIVTLEQHTPAFVLRVGETELTVDESIAQEILTRAQPSRSGQTRMVCPQDSPVCLVQWNYSPRESHRPLGSLCLP